MPTQFQHTFTGKDTGVEIQPLDRLSRSQERMNDFLVKAEELKYKTFKENQDWMLQTTKVTPVAYISEKNTEMQAKLLEDYNNQAAQILKKSGGVGNLSLEDKLALQKGRQALESAQAKMNADLERFKMDEEVMQKDAGRNYDINEWNALKQKYLLEGSYPETPLPVKETPFESWLTDQSKGYTGDVDTYVDTTTADGVKLKQKVSANMTTEQAQELIKQGILLNEGSRKNVMKRFDALPEAEKIKWLDANKDGQLDDAERTDENGIIAWAQNNPQFVNTIRKVKAGAYSNLQPSQGKSGSGISISIGGREVEVPIGKLRDGKVNYGGIDYNGSYSFGGKTVLYDIPTTGGKRLSGSTPFGLGNGNAEGQLVDYNPEKDVIIVRAAASIPKLNVTSNQLLEIPASNIEGVNNLPIEDANGKQTTVGSIRGKTATQVAQPTQPTQPAQPTKSKMSLINWKKANPNAPATDYMIYLKQ